MSYSNTVKYILNKEVYEFILKNNNIKSEANIYDPAGIEYRQNSFPLSISIPESGYNAEYMEKYGDNFRAGPKEWWAFALATHLACHSKIKPTVCELGSSQGLWSAAWIKILSDKNIYNTYALGIEASNGLQRAVEFWNNQKINLSIAESESGFSVSNEYSRFDWINRAISHIPGIVKFPDIDITTNNGAAINNAMNHNISGFIEVESITSEEILNKTGKIGFLHIDIQGEELNMLRNNSLSDLIKQSSIIVIGTHSVEADIEFIPYMESFGRVLIGYTESSYFDNGELSVDGEQIWLTKDILDYCILNKYIS